MSRRIDHIGRFLFAIPLVLGTVLFLAGSPASAADDGGMDAPTVAVLPTSGIVDAIMAAYLEEGVAKAARDVAEPRERLRAEQRQAQHELDREQPVGEQRVGPSAPLRARLDRPVANRRGAWAAPDEESAGVGRVVAGQPRRG